MPTAPAAPSRRKQMIATSAMGLIAALPAGAALAQSEAPTPLGGVQVTGVETPDYKVDTNSIARLTQSMVDTPQQIETISHQLMQDQKSPPSMTPCATPRASVWAPGSRAGRAPT